MSNSVALVIAGLVALYCGGELLVRGAVNVGRWLGLSSLVVGLTIVAFGTSAPELAVSVEAALKGSSEIAIANVVGSNIANIALVLALSAVLASEPYPILTAKSAGHAFELLATHKVGVVIADYRMPGMAGDEFLSRVRAMYPRAVRIMMSAQADSKSVITALNDSEIYKFLEKPVPLPTLRQVVRSAFDLFERHDPDSEPDDAPNNVLVG